MDEEQPFATCLADTLQLPSSSDGPLLPVPTSPHKNRPLHRFSLSDLLDGTGGRESLGPEIAVADINIASKFIYIFKRPILIINQMMAVLLSPPLVQLFTSLREDMTNLLELALPSVLHMLSLLL